MIRSTFFDKLQQPLSIVTVALWAGVAVGCASDVERRTLRDLDEIERQLQPLPDHDEAAEPAPAVELDGSRESYLAYAFANNPSLRASFEEWRAESYGPRQAYRLPDPVITYTGFIRSVETRVGPQLHKLGAMQWFPWPSKIGAGRKAAAHQAESAQRRFEAHALDVAAEVTRAYWALWRVQQQRALEQERVHILEGLSAQVRTRVALGHANLSDLAQVDLTLARTRDRMLALDEEESMAAAELLRAIGAPAGLATPMRTDPPPVGVPAENPATLRADAERHPRIDALASMSRAADERSRQQKADRFPSLGLGVDWIITGKAMNPMPDSGKDPVMVMASVKVPLWQRSDAAGQRQAEATGDAFRARELGARRMAGNYVDMLLAKVRDTARRVKLHDTTLVPQAEGAFESVVGSYQTGSAGVAALLIAERDLIDLQLARLDAQTTHATAWAELERAVGRAVQPGKDRS